MVSNLSLWKETTKEDDGGSTVKKEIMQINKTRKVYILHLQS